MYREISELEKLIFPTFPSYKRSFVKEISEYLCCRPDFFRRYDFRKLSSKQIQAFNSKRKLSSAGVKIISYASKFLDEQIDLERLYEAEETLSKGINDLGSYEVTDRSLAAVHDLRGYVDVPPLSGLFGGRAPIEGEMEEKKPSGYSSFTLSEDTSKEYLSSLRKSLLETVIPLEKGFKSEEKDKNFEVLIKSLLSEKVLNLVHVRSVNDYIRSVHGHTSVTCKLSEYFEESELTGLHKLPEREKLKRLKDARFKIMRPFTEKVSLFTSKYQFPISFGGLVGGAIISTIAIERTADSTFFKNPFLWWTGITIGIGSFMVPFLFSFNLDKIKYDRKVLRRIEYLRTEKEFPYT